jgi:chromosome segregation ATPase
MQKVIDAWQTQATSTQEELTVVISEAESLRTQNVSISTELYTVKNNYQQFKEKSEQWMTDLAESRIQAGQAQATLNEVSREREQLIKLLDASHAEARNFKGKLKMAVEGALISEHAVKDLEGELEVERVESSSMKEGLLKAAERINNLEGDKAAILLKLENTIGILEERTSMTIEKATSRLQDGDRKLKSSEVYTYKYIYTI